MKKYLTAAAILAISAATANAASVERVGAKVAGESAWVTAIQFVSQEHGLVKITTETEARGRSIENTEVVPAGTFNPANMASAIAYIQARYGVTPGTGTGGDVNAYVRNAGADGILGNADDGRSPVRDRDHF